MTSIGVSCAISALTILFQSADPLLFREDWKESPAEIPLNQKHVSNPQLKVSLYGPGLHGIKKSHHDWIENDPYYVWSGACPGNWAVTLRSEQGPIDLSGNAKVRWRSRQSGFRQLRLILKLQDGKWLVSDISDDESEDWRVYEFDVSKARWRVLNISRVTEGAWVENPSLSHVEEIGFSDLMPGGVSAASSRLDWIEVYGKWAGAE
jgi:hypothetical protein